MTYFKDYTFKWWQFSLLKVSLLALGILIGKTWPAVFSGTGINALLWVVFAVPAVYLAAVAYKQIVK